MDPDGSTLLFRRAGTLSLKAELRAFARRLQNELTEGRSFSCLLTDDRALHQLNAQFLSNNYPTDVLSFPSGADEPLGEIAISVDRARAQAESYGIELFDELRILMLHGVLHLMGHDHENDRGAMARMEKSWRRKLGLPSGLIERAHA